MTRCISCTRVCTHCISECMVHPRSLIKRRMHSLLSAPLLLGDQWAPYTHYTIHSLHHTLTAPYTHCTIHSLHHTLTTPYTHCTIHSLHIHSLYAYTHARYMHALTSPPSSPLFSAPLGRSVGKRMDGRPGVGQDEPHFRLRDSLASTTEARSREPIHTHSTARR
jgi:hypothetical protein